MSRGAFSRFLLAEISSYNNTRGMSTFCMNILTEVHALLLSCLLNLLLVWWLLLSIEKIRIFYKCFWSDLLAHSRMNIQSCKIWSLKNTLSLKCLLGYLSVDNVHSTKIKSLMFTISEIYFLHCAF